MVFEAFNTVYSGNTAWEEGSGLEMKPGAGTIQDNYDTLYTSEATAAPLYTVVEPLLTDVGDTNEHFVADVHSHHCFIFCFVEGLLTTWMICSQHGTLGCLTMLRNIGKTCFNIVAAYLVI